MRKAILISTAVLALAAAPAFAQTATAAKQPASKASAAKQASDQTFVMKAARGGMAEVELGKLAQDKATNDQVKNFAKRMVDDHSKANDELQTLAKNKSITLPTDLTAKDKATRDRLSKLSGDAFDRAYMSTMLTDHRKDVSEFRIESKSGRDADVKAFAAKTLPTLEDHLKLAQDANRAVGTSGVKSSKRVGTSGKKK